MHTDVLRIYILYKFIYSLYNVYPRVYRLTLVYPLFSSSLLSSLSSPPSPSLHFSDIFSVLLTFHLLFTSHPVWLPLFLIHFSPFQHPFLLLPLPFPDFSTRFLFFPPILSFPLPLSSFAPQFSFLFPFFFPHLPLPLSPFSSCPPFFLLKLPA